MASGRKPSSAKPFSKASFARSAKLSATIQRLHASLKLRIREAIALSVRSRGVGRRQRTIGTSETTKLFRPHRCVSPIPRRESSDVTERCRGCEGGSKRHLREDVRSYFLQGKRVSARPRLSTHSCEASLPTGAFG